MNHAIPTRSNPARWALRLSLLGVAALVACGGAQDSARSDVEEDLATIDSTRDVAIVDDGRSHALGAREMAAAAAPGFIPTGDPDAQTKGVFGPVIPWPLMPIHQVLLPDGRVLIYGSDINGKQGGGVHYAVWDPTLGTGTNAFLVLPTVTGTDLFCAGQALLPDTGDVLIVGGTIEVNGARGYGSDDSNIFAGGQNTLLAQTKMAYKRWYPTLLTLASGDQLALGGRIEPADAAGGGDLQRAVPAAAKPVLSAASAPEVWNRTTGWKTLTNAVSDVAYGGVNSAWYYPRAWVAPNKKVFLLGFDGDMYQLDPGDAGTLTQLTGNVGKSNARLQAVMYQPGKIFSVRQGTAGSVTVDINGAQPVFAPTQASTRYRLYGNATLLADGQVWMNGGSADGNESTNDYFVSETWNPATGAITDGATALIARLYHSSAILLPDASVATGGGGDPGPFKNLNGEIYYPPYLYLKDGTGTPAPRPVITGAPDSLGWGKSFKVSVSSSTAISRVTLIRTGTVTHNFNTNQRFQDLSFSVNAAHELVMKTPATAALAPPGYYMLFVFDSNGVPSVAKIFQIAATK